MELQDTKKLIVQATLERSFRETSIVDTALLHLVILLSCIDALDNSIPAETRDESDPKT